MRRLALLAVASWGALFAACGVDGVTPDCSSPEAGCGFVSDATADVETSADATDSEAAASDGRADSADTSTDAGRDGDAKADG